MKKKVLLVILALVCAIGLAACDISAIIGGDDLVREFTITFETDGSVYSTLTTNGRDVITLPDPPAKDGYIFDGWYFDKETWRKPLREDTLLSRPIFYDKTVYAKWREREDEEQKDLTYRIEFDTDGGTPVAPINTNRIETEPVTTKEGYIFEGWYLFKTSTQRISFPYIPDFDRTLYAKWRERPIDYDIIEYTVSFAKGDETGGEITGEIPEDQTVLRNREIVLPANPFAKEGYDFLAWSDGQGYYNPGQYYTVTADVTFTAIWRPRTQAQKFSLSFGPGDGEGITGNPPASAEYEAYEEIILPANPFTRAGYRFAGWYDAVANKVYQAQGSYTTAARATILVARWEIINYAITYFNISDIVNIGDYPATYTINTPTFSLPAPQRLGYSFEGWYADPDYTTPAVTTITAGSTGEKVFYARWSRIELTRQLNAQGTYTITGYTSNSSEIVVPDKLDNIPVTEIAPGAFRNNTSLTSLIIPSSVTRIGAGILSGCHNLVSLTIPFVGEFSSGNTARNSVLGYLFGEVALNEPGAVVQYYTDNPTVAFAVNSKLKFVTITSASSVPASAFQNILSLEKVTLNSNVLAISRQAFAGCAALKEVDFAFAPVTTIGASAFAGCSSLKTFTVPSTVVTLGANCFEGSGITTLTIPNSVNEIGRGILASTNIVTLSVPYIGRIKAPAVASEGVLGYFFAESPSGVEQYLSETSSARYAIPASLTTLNVTDATRLMYGAISNCSGIRNLTLNSAITFIAPYALYNTGITGVTLGNALTSIGAYAFAQSKRLYSLYIPFSVTTLGESAFRGCTALTEVTFVVGSRVTAIPQNCFRDCTALNKLTLQEGIRSFGDSAFRNCSDLPTAYIPNSTQTIGAYAFANCSSLSSSRANNDQSVIIPATVTSIGNNAFENCSSIRVLTFTAGALATIGDYAFAGCTGIGTTETGSIARTTITIPASVTEIGDYAFYNCVNVSRLDLNRATSRLAEIGEYAFAGWTNLGRSFDEGTIYTLEIPSSVVTIGAHAFRNASSLRQIVFEGTKLTTIGAYAFAGASSLGLNLAGNVNDNYTLMIPDSVTTIGDYAFAGTAQAPVRIRNFIFTQDSTLAYIGAYAFAYCSEITRIDIGRFVSYIGEGAFRGTSRLSAIDVSAQNMYYLSIGHSLYDRVGNSATKLIKYATGRTDTAYTVYEGVVEIGSYAFETDKTLQTIIIPSSVTVISKNAFEGSSAEIVFDRPTITVISDYAFYGYERDTLNLPASLLTLGDYALAGSDIAFVNIPQSLRNIGAYAFAGTPITEITIPAGVISISPAAFAGCDNLASINVAPGNALYTASEGVLYERSDLGRVLLQYPAAKAGTSYTVPSDVVAIKSKAFDGARLTSLVVPDTVTSIEEGAFFGLGSLVSLTVPFVGLSVSSPSTLGGMFGAVTENTSGAVRQGQGYYMVPATLANVTLTNARDLANYAFQNLRLASVNLGNKLETIGIYAFENCTADVVFGAGSIIDRIGVYAFAGFAGQSVAIPDSVVNIDEYAFRGAAVKDITFGQNSSLAGVGQYAFSLSALEALYLPDTVVNLGRSILEGVGNLTGLSLPFIGSTPTDSDNTLAYIFGAYTTAFEGAIAQTRRNGTTVYAAIPRIESIRLAASVVPVGVFMNVNAGAITLEAVSLINEYAFTGCRAQVVFGENSTISSVRSYAFENYAYTGPIALPATVTTVSQNAFYGARISAVSFGNGLQYIENNAFAYCVNLGSGGGTLTLPATLQAIGVGAFYNTAYSSVYIPAEVSDIGEYAFGVCENLTEIRVASGNPYYKDTNGVLYTKNGETLLQYPSHSANTEISVPAGVKVISRYAFAGNTAITSVVLPSTLTAIEEYAFAGSAEKPMGLTSVIFQGVNSDLATIDRYAFAFCVNLTSVTLPRNLVEIREGAFSGSKEAPMGLQTVVFAEGSRLSVIGDRAFAYCASLESLTVPRSITTIGESVLEGCESIESLSLPYVGATPESTGSNAVLGYLFGEAATITAGSTMQYYSATDYAYFNIPMSLRSVTLTGSTSSDKATSVPYGAFYNCGSIEWINLHADMLVINAYAFYACTSIRSISIPGKVTTIGAYAFAGTNYRPMSLETVTIGQNSNLFTIGEGAFYNCALLTSFYLPVNITAIDRYTFYNTAEMSQFTLHSGSRLYSIGEYAFYNSGITGLNVPADIETIGRSAFENSNIASFTIAVPQGAYRLTSIGDRAFAGCVNLTSFFVPGSITANGMGNRVFYDCVALESVTFANGALADLGEYAFYNCYSLESVTLPNSLASIRDYQFYGSRSLRSINIPASVRTIGAYAFAGKDGIAMKLESVSFASGSVLESIGAYAFNLCFSLTTVQIPDSLETIGERAFYNCNKLSTLQIGGSSNLRVIGDYAFSGCVTLTYIFIPQGVEHIGEGAFRNTGFTLIDVDENNSYYMSHEGNLLSKDGVRFIKYASANARMSYTLPASVRVISSYAFADTVNLKTVTLPEGLLDIEEYAFSASGLASLTIPETVRTIGSYAFTKSASLAVFVFDGNSELQTLGSYAFFNCTALIEVILPSGIVEIPDSLFYGCVSLYKVGMGFVTKIGKSAFYGAVRLTQITLPTTLTSIGEYAFFNCASLSSFTAGPNLSYIGVGAFAGCDSLTRIEVSPENDYYVSQNGVLYTKNYTELLVYPAGKPEATYIINSRTTSISAYAFMSAKNLKSLSLPLRISYIGNKAFYGATSLVIYAQASGKPSGWHSEWNTSCPVYWSATVYNYGTDFQFVYDSNGNAIITRYLGSDGTVTFPTEVWLVDAVDPIPVVGIGSGALLGLNHVYSVLILNNITYIGERAFENNPRLTIYCQAAAAGENWHADWNISGRPVYWSVNAINTYAGSFEYIIVNSSNVTITRYIGGSQDPEVPQVIDGINVTRIGPYAFSASDIVSVRLPSTLQAIDTYAFAYCENLASVSIPASVRTINNYAFAYCTSLAAANIAPSSGLLSTLGWGVFMGCSALEQIIIPETVSTMGGQVFKDCKSDLTIIVRHTLSAGEPASVPNGFNNQWNMKGYLNGVAQFYQFVWQRA